MKLKLELPKTLRPAEKNEVPMKESVTQKINSLASAKIVEGYKVLRNEKSEDIFNFYAEININNSNLWKLIKELSNELSDEVSLIFGEVDYELNHGIYSEKKEIFKFIKNYEREIVEDVFINIGIVSESESQLIEIFVIESKYIQFWGVNEDSFRKIMNNFNLKEIDGIEFIDEYPRTSRSLEFFYENITKPSELIEILKKKFG